MSLSGIADVWEHPLIEAVFRSGNRGGFHWSAASNGQKLSHRLACVLKVVAGVVFSAKCSIALIPCDSMYAHNFCFAIARVRHTPRATVLRMR